VWVFGYGHIGKIIADTLAVLGMAVTVVDPYETRCPHVHLQHWKEGRVRDAKAVILACGLNSSSEKILNAEFFSALGDDVLIINGARGKLIEEPSLKHYLKLHPGSFAFLDVFEKEPFEDHWHNFPQVWKTSHIAGVEIELDDKILSFEKEVLNDFVKLEESEFRLKYHKELLQNKWIKGALI
jgi:D-3-phosphoglycerate dehydrogenase / 2-oxoglutarate reductase